MKYAYADFKQQFGEPWQIWKHSEKNNWHLNEAGLPWQKRVFTGSKEVCLYESWAVLCRFWELSYFAARLQAGSAKKIGDFVLMCKSYWLQNVEMTTDFNLQVKCLMQDVYLVIKMFQ